MKCLSTFNKVDERESLFFTLKIEYLHSLMRKTKNEVSEPPLVRCLERKTV